MKGIASLIGAMESGRCNPFDVKQDVNKLKEAFTILNEKHTFSPGDLVEWKPGLKNKRTEGPFIVIMVLDDPVVKDDDSGSSIFREPMDIIVGQHDIEGDFDLWHLDSRRLRPYQGE